MWKGVNVCRRLTHHSSSFFLSVHIGMSSPCKMLAGSISPFRSRQNRCRSDLSRVAKSISSNIELFIDRYIGTDEKNGNILSFCMTKQTNFIHTITTHDCKASEGLLHDRVLISS